MVPNEVQVDRYFPNRKAFSHRSIFNNVPHVFAVLNLIETYIRDWIRQNIQAADQSYQLITHDMAQSYRVAGIGGISLMTESVDVFSPDKMILSDKNTELKIGNGCKIYGGVFDLSNGPIFIGNKVHIEPGTFVRGPVIIGDGCTIRHGAYVRGNAIIGRSVVLRCEIKNVILMDQAELCHPGYCGDSICGFKTHFGNQVTTANLSLSSTRTQNISIDGTIFETGCRKVGLILGDYSQVGCSAVTDPCTLIAPNTIVYPLTRLSKGIYGPNEIIKNKPLEKGFIERVKRHENRDKSRLDEMDK